MGTMLQRPQIGSLQPEAPDGRGDAQKSDQSRDDQDRIETGTLPIGTAKVQPHAELVECQGEPTPASPPQIRT